MSRDFSFLVAPLVAEFVVFLVVVDLFFGECVGSDLCPGGKLRRLYIGRRWGGQPITMVCVDNHVDIKITATGAQIAAYTLTEEKIYYNKKDNKLSPQRGN